MSCVFLHRLLCIARYFVACVAANASCFMLHLLNMFLSGDVFRSHYIDIYTFVIILNIYIYFFFLIYFCFIFIRKFYLIIILMFLTYTKKIYIYLYLYISFSHSLFHFLSINARTICMCDTKLWTQQHRRHSWCPTYSWYTHDHCNDLYVRINSWGNISGSFCVLLTCAPVAL